MKIEWIKGLVAVFLVFMIMSCRPSSRCDVIGSHEFLIPSTLTPARDTFSVGDTIFFSSIFEDRVYDRGLGEHVVLSDYKFNPGIFLNRLDTVEQVCALNDFLILFDSQYEYNINRGESGEYIRSEYLYNNGSYQLEFRIVPRKKGLYLFSYTFSLNFPVQEFEGMCPNLRGWLDSYSDLNGTADNNIEFLELSPNSHYNDWILLKPEDRFHSKGGYCFFVKE